MEKKKTKKVTEKGLVDLSDIDLTNSEDREIGRLFGLPQRHIEFACWHFSTGRGAFSVEKAGYTGTPKQLAVRACQLKKYKGISAFMEWLRADRGGLAVSKEWIISKIAIMAKSTLTNQANRLKALEILAKIHGLLDKDTAALTPPTPFVIKFEGSPAFTLGAHKPPLPQGALN